MNDKNVEERCRTLIRMFFRHVSGVTEKDDEVPYLNLAPLECSIDNPIEFKSEESPVNF
jgi:hypothetical protein